MRRNGFKRGRTYWQHPSELISWIDERGFCDAANRFYERDRRMMSWRRP